jgi:hypothetical protein
MKHARSCRRLAFGALAAVVASGSVLGATALARRADGFRPLAPEQAAACRVGGRTYKVCRSQCSGTSTLPCPRPTAPFNTCPDRDNLLSCKTVGECWGCSTNLNRTVCDARYTDGVTCTQNGGTGNPCGQMEKPDCQWTWTGWFVGVCSCGGFVGGYPDGDCTYSTNCS